MKGSLKRLKGSLTCFQVCFCGLGHCFSCFSRPGRSNLIYELDSAETNLGFQGHRLGFIGFGAYVSISKKDGPPNCGV